MEHSPETRQALTEQRLQMHEQQDEERAERTATDIGAIRGVMERESGERKAAVGRIHERVDEITVDVAETKHAVMAMQSALEKMPALIAEQINTKVESASSKAKNWAYSKVIAGVIGLIGLAIAIWQAIKGN